MVNCHYLEEGIPLDRPHPFDLIQEFSSYVQGPIRHFWEADKQGLKASPPYLCLHPLLWYSAMVKCIKLNQALVHLSQFGQHRGCLGFGTGFFVCPTWRCQWLNLGPFASKACAFPLSHTPFLHQYTQRYAAPVHGGSIPTMANKNMRRIPAGSYNCPVFHSSASFFRLCQVAMSRSH